MNQKTCNLWIEKAEFRCIPCSGAVTSDGLAIMDTGVALEANQRFHNLDLDLGRLLTSRGNHCHLIRPGVVSFPIKQYQWSGLSLDIVKRSGHELCSLVGDAQTLLPIPTDSEGNCSLEEVAKALDFLPDNVVVINHS